MIFVFFVNAQKQKECYNEKIKHHFAHLDNWSHNNSTKSITNQNNFE